MNIFSSEAFTIFIFITIFGNVLIWAYQKIKNIDDIQEDIEKDCFENNKSKQKWLKEKRENSNKNIQPRKQREHVCSYCGTYKPNPGKCSKCGGPESEGEYLDSFDISNVRGGGNDELDNTFPDTNEDMPW